MSTLSNDLHGNALYRWEQGLSTSSWENVVQEDAEGHLIAKSSQQNDLQRSLKSKQSRISINSSWYYTLYVIGDGLFTICIGK